VKPVEEIVEIKKRVEKELLDRPGVTGVDVGYKYVKGEKTDEISIRVLVEKKKDVPAKDRIPSEIDGVPTDVIEREYELHQGGVAVAVEELELMSDTGTYDPLKGGISIGPCRVINGLVYVGTLGCMVRDNATNKPLLLSNFHVMCVDNNWHTGDTMAQPGRVDGGSCPANVVGKLERAVLSGHIDAAVASHDARGITCDIVDIGSIKGTTAATLGMPVRKRGRTTLLTYGTVDSISLTASINYGPGLGVHTLTNQIGIAVDTSKSTQIGDHGDSGSVVVDNNRRVVGLYFAGNNAGTHGIANPIASVLAELDVHMCTSKVLHKELLKDFKVEKLEKEHFKLELKEHHPDKSVFSEKHGPDKFLVEHDPFDPIRPDQPFPPFQPPLGPFGGQAAGSPGDWEEMKGGLPGEKPAEADKPAKEPLKESKTEKPEKELKEKIPEKFEKPEGKLEKRESKEHKDHKDAKEHKEHKEHKDQKDHKYEGKELKDHKHEQKEHKDHKYEKAEHKHEHKEFKPEIKESKDAKHEKNEQKEHKHEKLEKPEIKENKDEKLERPEKIDKVEHPDKGLFENLPGPGPVEERISALEQQIGQLLHFIGTELRPDLGEGALSGETDL
jgi:hypothetical protein